MRIMVNHDNRRPMKSKVGDKRSRINERTSNQKMIYASRSEIDASIKFLLKKYAETFRMLAE